MVLISACLASGARQGGKNALQYAQMTTVCEGNHRQFFGSWFSDVNNFKQRERSAQLWRGQRNTHVPLHVRASGNRPVSLSMTHVRWLHGHSVHESVDYTRSVVQCVGGLRAWPIEMCSKKDAGTSESKTPTPCGCDQADTGSSRVLTTKQFGM